LQRIIVGQARHVAAASFEAEPSWNTFKAGRNYRFDWPAPAPVTAKY
jgi:hypothetical protein